MVDEKVERGGEKGGDGGFGDVNEDMGGVCEFCFVSLSK